jgi:hypothetical protein
MSHRMQPGVYYRALQEGNDAFIQGHFYNGGFYDGHQLIGQVDDDGTFRYFQGQDNGHPISPEHVAGHLDGLVLHLTDGTLLHLRVVDRPSLEAP